MSQTVADSAASAATGAPAAANPAPPPAAGAPVAPPEWRASLPAELRDAPSLAKFADVAALAKGYAEAETLIGRKGVIVPGEKDGPDVVARFRSALGVPEKPDGYALAAPEGLPAEAWDGERATAFQAIAHELGLTPAQAKGIAEWAAKDAAGALAKFSAGIEPDGRSMDDVLRAEWGGQYEARVDRAKRAAREFGDEAALTALEAKIGGAALVRMFAKIGEKVGEDQPAGMGTGASRGATGPAEAKAELAKLRAPGTPYWDKWHAEHKAAVARGIELERIIAGAAGG